MEEKTILEIQNAGMAVTPILFGAIFIIAGVVMRIFPPKKINSIYGYRTPQSMSSQEKWDFAQQYSAQAMIIVGVVLAAAFLIEAFINPPSLMSTIVGAILMTVGIAVLFIATERAMKKLDK